MGMSVNKTKSPKAKKNSKLSLLTCQAREHRLVKKLTYHEEESGVFKC
jgi:hypothetical protein